MSEPTHYRNCLTVPLMFKGRSFGPGAIIPADVDAEQLALFAAQGVVEPTTAPANRALRVPLNARATNESEDTP